MPLTERLDAATPAHISRAAHILRAGGTVAFPTETVYGLGANALDPAAVEKIFAAKQRPHWDPLIVHLADLAILPQIAEVNTHTARELIERFWPGPLTLLLPRTAAVPAIVTAGRPLVGVRMPNHSVALELIRQAGVPIAAPSANTFGHTSPTTAQHVLDDLDGRIDAVLDGGPCTIGLESTVLEVDPSRGELLPEIILYRAGSVTVEDLEGFTERVRTFRPAPKTSIHPASLPSPGVGLRHYAPRAKLLLVPVRAKSHVLLDLTLVDAIDAATTDQSRVAVMLPRGWDASAADLVYEWGRWADRDLLGQRLYDGLRELDDSGATIIICPVPEHPGIAEAIRDRLEKASRSS